FNNTSSTNTNIPIIGINPVESSDYKFSATSQLSITETEQKENTVVVTQKPSGTSIIGTPITQLVPVKTNKNQKLQTPLQPQKKYIKNLIKGSSTEFQEGLRKGEILVKTLESSRDPRILYKKEFELDDLTLGTWKYIANEIRKRNTNQVAEKYCRPKNKPKY